MRVAPSLAGLVLAAAMGAEACGGSGYQFVQNEDLGVYAKVPDGWTVYDESDLFPDDSDQQLERRRESSWMRTFDASDEPSVEGSQSPGESDPTGVVQVQRLTADVREQMSLSAMRGLGNPMNDPVAASRQSDQVEVLLDEPAEFEGGYHGVHTVFAVAPEPEGDAVVIDRTVLLDSASTTLFMFQVACEEQCYLDTHHDEITEIVESWTIQEGDR
jgi:hypothetical protein